MIRLALAASVVALASVYLAVATAGWVTPLLAALALIGGAIRVCER